MKLYDKMRSRLPEALNLPDQAMPGVPIIELYGDRRVLIEGRCAVVQYGSESVCVKSCGGMICICGKGLHMAVLSAEQMIITGCIECVSVRRG